MKYIHLIKCILFWISWLLCFNVVLVNCNILEFMYSVTLIITNYLFIIWNFVDATITFHNFMKLFLKNWKQAYALTSHITKYLWIRFSSTLLFICGSIILVNILVHWLSCPHLYVIVFIYCWTITNYLFILVTIFAIYLITYYYFSLINLFPYGEHSINILYWWLKIY